MQILDMHNKENINMRPFLYIISPVEFVILPSSINQAEVIVIMNVQSKANILILT
jgi:hypothetical protein